MCPKCQEDPPSPPLCHQTPSGFNPLPWAGCFGGRLILPFGMSHHHQPCLALPSPNFAQTSVPAGRTRRGPATTSHPRHQPGRDLSLTRPEEFLGLGARPGSARSSPDTTLGANPPMVACPHRALSPRPGLALLNRSDALKSAGVQGLGAGGGSRWIQGGL